VRAPDGISSDAFPDTVEIVWRFDAGGTNGMPDTDLTARMMECEDALDALEGGAAHSANRVAPEATAMGLTTEAPPEAAAVVNAASHSTRKSVEKSKPPEVASSAIKAAAGESPATLATPPASDAAVAAIDFSNPTTTTLLVHGVPRASAALGLKSYIEKLDFVTTVEPREFAAGLLRLQIDGARPFSLGDLSGWTLADRVELRSASNDLLELELAPA